MATLTSATIYASTSNLEVHTSAAFTPAANDLLVVVIRNSGTALTPIVSSSDGISFVETLLGSSTQSYAVAEQLTNAVSQTVSVDWTGDATTGATFEVIRISGMSRVGLNAVRQESRASGVAAVTPTVDFGVAALTDNPIIAMLGNANNPAGVTPPTNWTESADTGYNTPTNGLETGFRNSGFTGTTVTWGSSSASDWRVAIFEFDTTVPPASVQQSLMLLGVGS